MNQEIKYSSDNEIDFQEVEKVMVCAKWIIYQFEELSCLTLARVFQKAFDDAEAWIENIPQSKDHQGASEPRPFLLDAEVIRKLLIRYASIRDINTRHDILKGMEEITKKKAH